jgi:DNA-binding transcriptional MerR regulator
MLVDEPTVPKKAYFRIGEVSRLTGVKAYVLRYWESEFPSIVPTKTRANQRLYRREDVERILTIKRLLYQERYTIAGARARLEAGRSEPPSPAATDPGAAAAASPLPPGDRAGVKARLLAIRDALAALRAGLDD